MASRTFRPVDFEHGLRCADCAIEFTEGMPISERLESMIDDIPLVVLTCMPCGLPQNAQAPASR